MPVGTRLLVSVPIHTSTRRVVVCQIIFTFWFRRFVVLLCVRTFSNSLLCRAVLPPCLLHSLNRCSSVCVCVLLPCFPFSGTVVSVKFRVVLTHTTSPSQTTSSRHRETVFVSPCPPELVLLWSARVLQHSTAGTVSEQLRTSTLVPPKTK